MHTLLGIWMGHKYTRPWNGPSFLTAAIQEHTVLEPGHFPMLLSKHPWCGPGCYRFRARGLRWSNQSGSARHEGTHTQLSIIITKQSYLLLGLIEDSILDFTIRKPDFLVQFTNGFQTPNHRIPTVVWNFTCSADLKSGRFKISNGQKEVVLQIVWILNVV